MPPNIIDGRYQVLKKLGHTAMGEVYKVHDLADDSTLALKLSPQESTQDDIVRFRREFYTLSRLRHANVIEVVDFGMLNQPDQPRGSGGQSRCYFSMEYVDGADVLEFFQPKHPFTRKTYGLLYSVLSQLCHALFYIHSKGLIHCDLKPGNILVTTQVSKSGGQSKAPGKLLTVKLLDFGLAGELADPSVSFAAGTLGYVAPEVLRSGNADARSDLYSLGVVLWEILTRRRAFPGRDPTSIMRDNLIKNLSPPRSFNSTIPEALESTVLKLVKKEPSERHISALEVLKELSSLTPEVSSGRLPSLGLHLLTSSLVGRDGVVSDFRSLLDKAEAGDGQVMVLSGERGIGKSRLLQELKSQAQLSDSTVLFGACCQSERFPFSPWGQILSQLRQRDGREIPLFARQVSGSPELMRIQRLQVFERAASRIVGSPNGNGRPLVILIDDLDLADPNALDFLLYLSRSLGKSKVVLVAFCEKNTRLEERLSQLNELPFATRIELRQLKQEHSDLMVFNMLGSHGSHEPLARWVHKQAGGNPLLIEETLSSLVTDGILRRKGMKWSIDPADLERAKPSQDAESIIQAWLGRLNRREAELLSAASILGDGFDLRVLERLSGISTPHFFEALDNLEARGLVRREQGADFAFAHKWAQRMLYGRISGIKRKNLHAEAAEIIEELFPDRCFDLADHYTLAGIKEKAYASSLLAGRRAAQSFANREALRYYQNALTLSRGLRKHKERPALLEEMGDMCNLLGEYDDGLKAYRSACAATSQSKAGSVVLPTLLRKIATIQHKRGEYGEAMESLQKAKTLADKHVQLEETARIMNEMGWVHQSKGEYDRALQCYQQGLQMAQQRQSPEMLARSYYNLGAAYYRQDDLAQAANYCRKALRIDRQAESPYGLTSSLGLMGAICRASGECDKAARSYERSLKLALASGDVYGQTTSFSNLGVLAQQRGELDGALDYLSQGLHRAQKIGDPASICRAHNNLGIVYQYKGEWEKALYHYEESFRASQRTEDPLLIARYHNNLGSVYLQMERREEAMEHLKQGLEIREKAHDRQGIASSYENIGRLMIEKGRVKKGLGYLEKSGAAYEELGTKYNLPEVLSALADVHLSLGDLEKASEYCRNGLKLSQKIGNPFAQGSCCIVFSRYCLERGDREGMETNLSKGIEIFRGLGARLELGKSLLEAGRLALRAMEDHRGPELFLSARSHLKEARQIFRDLGAKTRFSEAEAALDVLVDRLVSGRFDALARTQYLKVLRRIGELVDAMPSEEKLLDQVLDLVLDLLRAERGLILLTDEKSGQLLLGAGRNVDRTTVNDATRISKTIVDRVTETEEPVISNDASQDPMFRESDSVVLNSIRSLLCVPLRAKGKTVGTIYVDSRVHSNLFSGVEEDFLTAVSGLIGSTIDQSKLAARLARENVSLRRRLRKRRGLRDMVGRSDEMQKVYEAVEKIAATNCTVLLQGETGTGKELLARAIHHLGQRSTREFLTIDCSALVETLLESELFGHKKGSFTGATQDKVGLFEEADKGTLFLDEIGDASLSVQAKLLRAIESGEIRRVGETKWRKVDVRVICATNKYLEDEVDKARFRQDLFYRLNTFTIRVPPLRDRTGDIYLLARHFLKRHAAQFKKDVTGFAPEALNYLVSHPWPGNVRQLEKTIERAVIMCDGPRITLTDISPESAEAVSRALSLKEIRAHTESERVRQALVATRGNLSRAARDLGIARRQLYRLIERYRIDVDQLRE